MQIEKILNNNVVTVIDDQNIELVIMGRGLAFKKKRGDILEEDKIEKIFTLNNQKLSDKLKTLLSEIPIEHMELSEEIINFAKLQLGKMLDDSIYVSLTDHISFALERFSKGMKIKNAMLWEIKKFYKEEYEVGKAALQIIHSKFGVRLPEDEAGHIALHLVNAELNEEMPNMVNITKIMNDILNIVKHHFRLEYDEESLSYYRFITHLKFFAQRLINGTPPPDNENGLFNLVKEQYKDAFASVEKIKIYIDKTYNRELTNDEMLYLTIHIERITNQKME
ncbi:transcription antiterminator LicT [Paenibacillus sp. FSL R5-0345]|uniref:Transcription antiterminator LicT n=1 Tax=Paenibacillus odorifer TaxID=189426 RepID=A0A1R0XNJ8_9BACL|nr:MULTISPECIES: PRD domain-containing protein [Paenibacillus]AIQ37793.1 transcription antiterminator LicT [Paenibacillus sp. FSL R5-0345]OMD36668.1 transcription antiterminator LicT [Paenibacillus odorifer]